ncbi:MAG: type II and III secretion system protein family protein, partial [Pseudomonadota bacterium]
LVQPPTDYSLTVAAGTSQLLNSSQPVTNVIASDPNVANAHPISATQIAVHGIGLGSTNMFGIGDGGQVVFAINVDTVPNEHFAQSQLRAAAPGSGANVALESGRLTAQGQVAGVGEAIDVQNVAYGLEQTQGPTVNNTTINGSQQVRIQVRFAEISRNDVFNLGINWNAIFDGSDFLFGLATGNFLSSIADTSARDIASGSGEEFARIDFNGEFGDFSVDAFVDALQREGIVNLLAEPNLTSVNGEPASFHAGGEVPILVPGGGGDDSVTIEYKKFGVSLDFVPTLLPGERINLRVRPEVSSISSIGAVVLDDFAVPAFNVRSTETSVELASGQTFAIAGLFQRDLATDTDKFPLLGDVPVLGQLFQSERFQRRETELVILITPYLVKPTSINNIALPNDRLAPLERPSSRRDGKRAGFIVN